MGVSEKYIVFDENNAVATTKTHKWHYKLVKRQLYLPDSALKDFFLF